MSDVNVALVAAGGLTVPLALVEVLRQAKSNSVSECLHVQFALYVFFLALGNVASTAAIPAIVSQVESQGPLPAPEWLWYVLLGVFAFQVVLKNTNVSILGRGVLSIDEWISKSRDIAVARTIGNSTTQAQNAAVKSATALRKDVSDAELNSYVTQYLGAEAASELERIAKQNGADAHLIKALALAYQEPAAVESILKSRKPT